jgi:hypothetical protein
MRDYVSKMSVLEILLHYRNLFMYVFMLNSVITKYICETLRLLWRYTVHSLGIID